MRLVYEHRLGTSAFLYQSKRTVLSVKGFAINPEVDVAVNTAIGSTAVGLVGAFH